MAIYHLHVKVIGRKSGSSAVASAAYRAGSRLRDERLDRSHDFSAKRGVVHSEVMLPEGAPQAWGDNRVNLAATGRSETVPLGFGRTSAKLGNPCRTPTPFRGVGVGQGKKGGASGFGNWRNPDLVFEPSRRADDLA